MFSKILVKAPSSCANLGSGFDCLGLALNLYNFIEVSYDTQNRFVYNDKEIYINSSNDIEKNFIFRIIKKFFDFQNESMPNFSVKIKNHIPLSRGLGSSSAAISSTLVAINSLCFDEKYSLDALLDFSLNFENHIDNLAASFLGGFVLSGIMNKKAFYYKFLDFEKNFDKNLVFLFVVPNYKIETENSRQILFSSQNVHSHIEYVKGLNKTILNIISFVNMNKQNLFFTMEDEIWHENIRKENIKFFDEMKNIAHIYKACGFCLSGSGPSILILTDKKYLDDIKENLLKIKNFSSISPKFLELEPNFEGVKILWKK